MLGSVARAASLATYQVEHTKALSLLCSSAISCSRLSMYQVFPPMFLVPPDPAPEALIALCIASSTFGCCPMPK